MQKPKRLFFDIETSFCIGWFWRPGRNQTVTASQIIEHAEIICICYKWEGDRTAKWLTWDKNQSDKAMLREFLNVLKEADEIIGHNGDKFDLAWIRTRCAFHRLPMFPNYRTLDTLKVSRSKFRFPSNRLNDIAEYLGIGVKKPTTEGLWKKVKFEKCEKSLKYMVTYCKHDVVLLEKVYEVLSLHTEPKVHHGVLMGEDRGSCPHCGSLNLHKKRYRTTATGMLRADYECNDCKKYHSKTEKGEVCQR